MRVSPAKDLRERAFQVFGAGLLDSLLPINGGRDYVAKVSGYVSAPRERRTTKDAQYFFVNKRFVRDKTIAGGLLEGYRSVLPHGVYPVAFLFLEIPHDEIDVNVHPAKTEVRFRRGEAVKDVIAEAVRDALARAGVTGDVEPERFERESSAKPFSPYREETEPVEQSEIDYGNYASFRQTTVEVTESLIEAETGKTEYVGNEQLAPVSRSDDAETREIAIAVGEFEFLAGQRSQTIAEGRHIGSAVLPPVNSAEKLVKPIEIEHVSAAKIRPLGQLHDSFIIAVDDDGLLLIDQHVAHERILFDKFRKFETERAIESQNLLLPETIDLSPAQSQAFQLIEGDLESLGFGLMRLSGRTIAIKSVPTDLPASEARNLFAEILDTIEAEKKGSPKSTLRDDIAASLACKAAVKINMKLTPEKMQWLIDRLLITTSPTTCPHGRPVILRLSMKDIERGFHRT